MCSVAAEKARYFEQTIQNDELMFEELSFCGYLQLSRKNCFIVVDDLLLSDTVFLATVFVRVVFSNAQVDDLPQVQKMAGVDWLTCCDFWLNVAFQSI